MENDKKQKTKIEAKLYKRERIKITLGMRKNRINIVENKISNINNERAYQ